MNWEFSSSKLYGVQRNDVTGWLKKWKGGNCLTSTMIDYYSESTQTTRDWLKVIILKHFKKMT